MGGSCSTIDGRCVSSHVVLGMLLRTYYLLTTSDTGTSHLATTNTTDYYVRNCNGLAPDLPQSMPVPNLVEG